MAIEYAVRAAQFVVYDGTNGQEIKDAACGDFGVPFTLTNESEVDGVLTFSVIAPPYSSVQNPAPYVFNEGDVYQLESLSPAISAADWASKYIKQP